MKIVLVLTAALWIILAPTIHAMEEYGWGRVDTPSVDVALDPGHSDADVGAVGGGLRECDLTLDLAFRVRDLLEERGFSVVMTRIDRSPLTSMSDPNRTEATRIEQTARIDAAGKASVYVSIHLNGYPDRRVAGAESYYNGDNHGEESVALARFIQGRLVSVVREAGYMIPDRGAREDLWAGKPYGHFFSLRGDSPSTLVEAMFLTNPREAVLLGTEEYRAAVALGIADGITEYLLASRPVPHAPDLGASVPPVAALQPGD